MGTGLEREAPKWGNGVCAGCHLGGWRAGREEELKAACRGLSPSRGPDLEKGDPADPGGSSPFGPKHPSAQGSDRGRAGGCPLGRCLSSTVGSEKDAFLGVSGWPQSQSQQLGSHCAHTHTETHTHAHTQTHTPHLPGEKGLPFAVRKLRLRVGRWQDPSRAHPEGRSWFPGQPPCDGESALRPEDRDSRVLPDSVCQV